MCCHAGQIFRLLGTAVPSSSNFFLNYVLTKVSEQASLLHKQTCTWTLVSFLLCQAAETGEECLLRAWSDGMCDVCQCPYRVSEVCALSCVTRKIGNIAGLVLQPAAPVVAAQRRATGRHHPLAGAVACAHILRVLFRTTAGTRGLDAINNLEGGT